MARRGTARLAVEVRAVEAGAAEVGAILLAAGASRRMGALNKLLLPMDGVPMVARVADAIRAAGLPMLVVLGHEADAVRLALACPPPERGRTEPLFVRAADWAEGMGASLAAGARAIPAHWSGAIVCLGDMPFVAAGLLGRLAAAIDGPDAIAVPVHEGRRGNPVGWGRAWFAELARSGGDTGGRRLLARAAVTEIAADAGIHRDLDNPGDLAASESWHTSAPPATSGADAI